MYQRMQIPNWCYAAIAAMLLPGLTRATAQGQETAQLETGLPQDIQEDCGAELTPEQAEVAAYLESIGAYDPPEAQLRFVLQVPVTLHVVRLDSGTNGFWDDGNGDFNSTGMTAALDTANTFWEPMGIQFFQNGPVDFIDDSSLINIDNILELGELWGTNVVQNSVNVYFVNQLVSLSGNSTCGIASFSYSPIQGVTVRNNCAFAATFAHELGHYFDLYHTHETSIGGPECPDGSNCGSAGDLVCDTPADPRLDLSGMLSGCTYSGTGTQCGDPYNPDPTNVMSYGGSCRTGFSDAQGARAATTLINIRTNLVEAGGNPTVTWVDFAAPGGGNGSYASPYNTLASGIANVAVGGRVVFKPGSTGATALISNPVTLDAFQGSAVIGN